MEPKIFAFLKRTIEDAGADARDRMEAAKLALAYSRGKPRQSVEMTGADGGPIRVSSDDLLAQLEKLEAAATKKDSEK